MSFHSDDEPLPPNPSQDMSKNWPLPELLLQLARTVYQRGKTIVETVHGILRNENETQTANGTFQTASPATSSAESIREEAHIAQDRLGSEHEVQGFAGDLKSEACNPEHLTLENSARQDVAFSDTGSRNHTEEFAISSANHAISASTPSLVSDTDITQLAATPPATTQLVITQSATTQITTKSLVDVKADRGQDVQNEFVNNEKQEKRGSVSNGEGYTTRKPKTSLMKVHTSKGASATSSEDISRILIRGLNPPDELCQGKNQVGDARALDCLSDLGVRKSDGRVDMVEEEARQGVHSVEKERLGDTVNVGKPAITPPAPVDDICMGLTLVDLTLDPVKNHLPSFLCHEERYPMRLTITSKSLEIPATSPDPSPMTSTSSSHVRMLRPQSIDSMCSKFLLRRKRKASSGTDAVCEHTAKFLNDNKARNFDNDITCNSSSWCLVLGVARRAMKDSEKVIGDHKRNEELEDSPCKVGYWGKSIAYGTEGFLELISDKRVMAVSERTGAPVWGGFWKDIEFWPGDLMSTLPPLGQTMENWSVARRHWLEGCSVFWSKREAEVFKILFGHVEAGPVRSIPMDIWVNDLDREAVRAKYLSFLH